MKNIVICSSAGFFYEAKKWKEKLEENGEYLVTSYPQIIKDTKKPYVQWYKERHSDHYKSIESTDTIFIMNCDKGDEEGYIGPSTFAEISFAIGLNIVFDKNIKIFYLNPLPIYLTYSDELYLWDKLGWIKQWPEKGIEGDTND